MLLTLYKSALRPIEIKALLKLKIRGNAYAPPQESLKQLALELNDREFCYAALGKVSRSFSAVIQQLPVALKDAVCIFYLVLRALDTIEDDMNLESEVKTPLLLNFYKHAQEENFSISGIGDNVEHSMLLENYQKVHSCFLELNQASQETIIDITRQMGKGMFDFSKKDVKTIADFDLYCHYVAGLVGIGLTNLFLAYNPKSLEIEESNRLANSMGLFLQKTNIIRDYHEDLFSDRTFWPEEIWSAHVESLDFLARNTHSPDSIAVLNHMIMDALKHVPDCIEYLNSVEDRKIFRFTAVPQIMAIATLAKLYNNPRVLKSVVKVRKGLVAKLMIYNISKDDMLKYFKRNISIIRKKNKHGTPYEQKAGQVLNSIEEYLEKFKS